MTLRFIAVGKPEPQGSAKAFIPKGWARPVITSDNPKNKGWRQTVAKAALAAIKATPGFVLIEEPVMVSMTFYLPRPKSLRNEARAHTTRPDLDKLARSVGDALTGIVIADDGQIDTLVASKMYAPMNGEPRAEISVTIA